MDEVASRCRTQLATFRIKELKDVLTRLGLPKQGKKQVLMDKIMGVLTPADWHPKGLKLDIRSLNKNAVSREEAAKVIDDIYRKVRGPAAMELATSNKNIQMGSASIVRSDDQDESATWEVRCPCGSSQDRGTMIQCDNRDCRVWQHLDCVIIPENTSEGAEPDIPSQFYCETCRIDRGDPFCVTIKQTMTSTRLSCAGPKAEGQGPLQTVEKTFTLSRADRDLLHRPGHDLQVWCVLLSDKVSFRMHWPAYADLRVNGVQVRVTNRPGTQLLGINGRDDGPGITTCTREGSNRISLSAYDARSFCMGVRVIRRCTVEQVLNKIPAVSEGEPFEEALARIRRCINGGGLGNADDEDDSDLEVVAESVTVNLRCPMSGSRIKVAGRFKPCVHMGCFDLNTFVELNQRARKWQCPICLKNYSLENLIIDPFFNRIATTMKSYGEDVTEVEMKADGFWRPKLEGEAKAREPWRTSEGTLVLSNGVHKVPEVRLNPVKIEEGISQERIPLKIGIKRTHDGQWAFNKITGVNSSVSKIPRPAEPSFSRSSSATDSNEENGYDDEQSVNQEPGLKDEYTGDNEVGNTTGGLQASVWKKNKPSDDDPSGGADVIVLSDSEDECHSPTAHSGREQRAPTRQKSPVYFPDGRADALAVSVNGNGNVAGTSKTRPFHVSHIVTKDRNRSGNSQGGLRLPVENTNIWSYGYFGSGSDGSARISSQQQPPLPLQPMPPSSEYGLASQQRENDIFLPSFPAYRGSSSPRDYFQNECNGFGEDHNQEGSASESSLRLFLPPQPARAPIPPSGHASLIPTDQDLDDSWFSLSLGNSETLNSEPSLAFRRPHEITKSNSQGRERLDSLASTASVLLGLNNSGSEIQPINSLVHARRTTSSPHHNSRRHYFRVESDSD